MILKGCQKKIILLKNTGSGIFDEAYFILSDSAENSTSITEGDMIQEANRIINANMTKSSSELQYKPKKLLIKWYIAGAASGGVILAVIQFLGRIF